MLLAKVDRLVRKTYFVQKNTKIMDNFLDRVTLEGAGGQTDDTRSTFRVPLKTLGYNGSNYGSMVGTKISLKIESFSENCPVPKFSTGKFSGASTHGFLTHSGFRKSFFY